MSTNPVGDGVVVTRTAATPGDGFDELFSGGDKRWPGFLKP
jgi:hypothetical protein